jgi:hypothetical protein
MSSFLMFVLTHTDSLCCVWFMENEKLVAGPRWRLTARRTGRLIVGRNVTSTKVLMSVDRA